MKRLLIIIVVGIIGHFLLPTSCEREAIYLDKELPYLSLNSGVDFSKLSRADQEVLVSAFNRVSVSRENGQYQINQKLGKEINISDELFEMLLDIVRNSNEWQLTKTPKHTTPRLKSGIEDPNTSVDTTASDCVAQVISTALTNFGTAMPYEDIDNWITG